MTNRVLVGGQLISDFLLPILMRELKRNPNVKYKIMPNGALKFFREPLSTMTHDNRTLTIGACRDDKSVLKAKSRCVGVSSWESRSHIARLPRSLTR